jgi:hypothetical protein
MEKENVEFGNAVLVDGQLFPHRDHHPIRKR